MEWVAGVGRTGAQTQRDEDHQDDDAHAEEQREPGEVWPTPMSRLAQNFGGWSRYFRGFPPPPWEIMNIH